MKMTKLSLLALTGLSVMCYRGAAETPKTQVSKSETAPVKIMFIGDSITAGKGYNWRYHLWHHLREAGYKVDFVGNSGNNPYKGEYDSDHEGYGGATADQVAKNAATGIQKYAPQIALIHLGTNDYISQKDPAATNAQEISGIVDQLRAANPKVVVFIAQIPFVSNEYRQAVAGLAQEKTTAQSPVTALDLNSDWQIKPGQDTVDWVHPNLNGVLKIEGHVFNAITPVLNAWQKPQPLKLVKDKKTVNLAAQNPVSADASADGSDPTNAIDGNPFTLWNAPDQKEHWLQVDLQSEREISGTGVMWDSAGAAYGYKIEASRDGLDWETVVDKSQNPGELSVALQMQRDRFPTVRARYVRIVVTRVPNESWTKYPVSIREFEVNP